VPSTLRTLAVALVAFALFAGCLGVPGSEATTDEASPPPTEPTRTSSPTETVTVPTTAYEVSYTPFPDTEPTFPDGPKHPPDRPATPTEESVSEFVRAYERRWVYNSMYVEDASDFTASVDCSVEHLTERDVGYVAVVGCTAYAEYHTDRTPGGTETPAKVHADWFTQYFTYLVDEDSLVRRDPTPDEEERAGVTNW
jgi:hypothetical protein